MRVMRLMVTLALLATVTGGCANQLRGMQAVPAEKVALRPPADRAAVVFLRPATSIGAHSATLFELRPGTADRFVGILVAETQLVDYVPAGKTRFMVLGRGAEFLDADLQAGKTYAVAVLPPPVGTSDSFFALVPVRGNSAPPAVRQCQASCIWVENTERSHAWSRRTWPSIQQKKTTHLPSWEARRDRPTLGPADGS